MIEPKKLASMLSDHQKYHSPFQIERFILDDSSGGTAYGYYKQCLRELFSRVQSLRTSIVELKRSKRQLSELNKKASQLDLFGNVRFPEVFEDYQLKKIEVDSQEIAIKDRWRELVIFYRHAENTRPFLGNLDDAKTRDKYDQDMWINTCKQRAQLELKCYGRLTDQTHKLMSHAPVEIDLTEDAQKFIPLPVDVEVPSLPTLSELETLSSCYATAQIA